MDGIGRHSPPLPVRRVPCTAGNGDPLFRRPWACDPVCLAGWLLACLVLTGCGSGEYERRMAEGQRRRQELAAQAARYDENLYGAASIGSTSARIRVPKVFEASYDASSPHPSDGATINPQRLKPPFLQQFPGFATSYEAFRPDPQGELPFYCYLGSMASDPAVKEGVLSQLKAAFPGSSPSWSSYDAATPAQGTVRWQKVRVTGPQSFFRRTQAGSSVVNLNGIFELHVHEGPGTMVFVGWRIPQPIVAGTGWEELALLMAGTVEVPNP